MWKRKRRYYAVRISSAALLETTPGAGERVAKPAPPFPPSPPPPNAEPGPAGVDEASPARLGALYLHLFLFLRTFSCLRLQGRRPNPLSSGIGPSPRAQARALWGAGRAGLRAGGRAGPDVESSQQVGHEPGLAREEKGNPDTAFLLCRAETPLYFPSVI